ncbi:perlucin-like protein [Diadema setosum]|uniref:perlucin-like protein n=1 Tax=Diadema setosum TaxID=31175 RepID=UPI003B3B50B0
MVASKTICVRTSGRLRVRYVLVCPGFTSSPDSCYLYRPHDRQPWEGARDRCHELGGYLVAMETPDELSSIREELLISHYGIEDFKFMWTGLNDRMSEGVYTWVEVGGTLAVTSKMWRDGQPWTPPGFDHDCISFRGYTVEDFSCNASLTYICEFKP